MRWRSSTPGIGPSGEPADGTRGLLSEGQVAISEAMLARRAVYEQIKELAWDSDSRRRYRDGMLSKILRAAIAGMNTRMGNIQLLDKKSASLRLHLHEGFGEYFADYFSTVKSKQSACGMALRWRSAVIVHDVTESEIFRDQRSLEVLLDSGVRSVESVPLIATTGEVVGIL